MTRTRLPDFVHQAMDLVGFESTKVAAGPTQLFDQLCKAPAGSAALGGFDQYDVRTALDTHVPPQPFQPGRGDQ
jgi:hypothetical protein